MVVSLKALLQLHTQFLIINLNLDDEMECSKKKSLLSERSKISFLNLFKRVLQNPESC